MFDRIEGRGNPWSLSRPHVGVDHTQGRDNLRVCARVKGREAKLLKLEPGKLPR